MDAFLQNLTFQGGANTTVVCIGAGLLGAGGGVVGVFALLRRRALMSDALSHATLPGVALAFLVGSYVLSDPKTLGVLLAGAAVTALLGVVCVQWIEDQTRLPEDAAIGTVLSTFYGGGIVLLSYAQSIPSGGQAGLGSFLLGSAAGLLRGEALLIAALAVAVIVVALAFVKELGLVAFDAGFAAASGIGVRAMDLLLMGLLTAVIVVGLKTVGLVLVIALVIIPPAAARFWTYRLSPMLAIAGAIGGAGAYVGAALSASAADLPTGGVIVLVLFAMFAVSMVSAPERGLVVAGLRNLRLARRVRERRALLGLAQGRANAEQRRWLVRSGLLAPDGRPTADGVARADAVARDDALWHRLLIDYPDEARRTESYGLQAIGEVLPAELVAELKAHDTRERSTAGPA